jgi:hypothetical protein
MSDDTIDDSQRVRWGIGGEDSEKHKAVINSLVAIFQYAWIEKPWKGKAELVGDSGQHLSFDEMVQFLGDLMITYPSADPASESLVSPNGDISTPQSVSEVTRV